MPTSWSGCGGSCRSDAIGRQRLANRHLTPCEPRQRLQRAPTPAAQILCDRPALLDGDLVAVRQQERRNIDRIGQHLRGGGGFNQRPDVGDEHQSALFIQRNQRCQTAMQGKTMAGGAARQVGQVTTIQGQAAPRGAVVAEGAIGWNQGVVAVVATLQEDNDQRPVVIGGGQTVIRQSGQQAGPAAEPGDRRQSTCAKKIVPRDDLMAPK